MLSAAVKYLDGTKWKNIEISQLKGKSIATHICFSKDKTIAALLKDNKPVMFVTNIFPDTEENKKELAKYEEKGLVLNIIDLMILFGSTAMPDMAINVFPDSTFVSVEETEEPKGEHLEWWKQKISSTKRSRDSP